MELGITLILCLQILLTVVQLTVYIFQQLEPKTLDIGLRNVVRKQ